MLVDILKIPGTQIAEIRFKLKDLKTEKDHDDLFSIACAVATSYCFEPMQLVGGEFELFLKSLKPRFTYAVHAGTKNGEPYFDYGRTA